MDIVKQLRESCFCEGRGCELCCAASMLQRDVEAIAAMTGERDRLREAASNAAHQLEQARIWNGSGWHWNHLRADVALHAWGILQEALREGGE